MPENKKTEAQKADTQTAEAQAATETKTEQQKAQERQRTLAAQQQQSQDETTEPTAQGDREALRQQTAATRDRGGRAAKVEVNPAEAQHNDADWLEGREPNDVVEVEGQRETVEAREARNGVNSPAHRAGATHL